MRTLGEGVDWGHAHMETETGSLMLSGRDRFMVQWKMADVWDAYILIVSRRGLDSRKSRLRTAGGLARWTGSPHSLDMRLLKRAGLAE